VNPLGAATCLFLALTSAAADKPKDQVVSGVVVQSLVRLVPSPDGPQFREGLLKMTAKDGRTLELKVTLRTRVTLDGKTVKYHKSAVPGDAVVRAAYNAKNEASVLDFKRPPAPAK
jgi:hypothetical protein